MTVYDYSANESLERIYNILKGINPSDVPETLGRMAWDDSLSRITQLLEGSLGGLEDEFLDTVFAIKYGGIWAWTGTAVMTTLSATVYTKITGTFQNASVYVTTGITATPSQDRIYINDVGNYLVHWSVSFEGDPNSEYAIEPYVAGIGLPEAVARARPSSSGTAINVSGEAIEYVSGTAVTVSLYVLPTLASTWFKPRSASIVVQRIGKAAVT